VLLGLACLTVTNTFAVLRLVPMSDRDKDTEILALRHQIAVLERQLGKQKVRFTPGDRAFLAALLHRLPPEAVRRLRLLVRPDTIVRWHRNLITRRHAARSKPKRPGRPRTVRSIRALVLRLVRENPHWGYRRVHGELLVLGVKVAAPAVWEILKEAGTGPAPERASSTWTGFLRSQAGALLACDFSGTVTLSGARMYVFAVIEHANRRIRILGATAQPATSWVVQAAKNLVMDLQDAGCRSRFLIRDRDGKYPQLFDAVLRDAGIEVVFSGVRMPRMNSIMERWVQTCRRELLDRTLIWNDRHLLHALREFEDFYNGHSAPADNLVRPGPPARGRGQRARHDVRPCCSVWRIWPSRTPSPRCVCGRSATATRTWRSWLYATRSPSMSGNSARRRRSSPSKIGSSLPRSWPRCPARPCVGCGCWSAPAPCCVGTAT